MEERGLSEASAEKVESFLLHTAGFQIRSQKRQARKNTNHRVELLLQMVVPGLLQRHDAVTKGLFAPPKNLLGDQVQAFEGVSQKVLLHSVL